MILIVRTFGAPVIEPLGKSARNTSARPVSGRSRAVTVDVSCQTVSNRSGSNTLDHRTVPGRAMRPRSLRSRSTIIAFSARSFTDAVSRSRIGVVLREPAAARRRALHRPCREEVAVQPEEELGRRGQDPVTARRSGTRRCGASLRVAQVAVETALVALHRRTQPERVVHLIGVAGRDVLADASRSPGRSGRDRRSAPTRRTAGPHRRAATADGLLALLEHREPGQRQPANGSSGARARTTSDGSSPGAASYVDEPGDPQAAGCGALGRRQRRARHPPAASPPGRRRDRSGGTTAPRRSGRRTAPRSRMRSVRRPCGT